MTSTLHDQLSRLADEATPPATAPGGRELWDRGVRYRRRLRVGTAAIASAGVAVLALVAGVTLQAAGPQPEPIPADAPAGIPSRIHTPSPWLPGTNDAGPPGQVVALLGADRGAWTGTTYGLVAISAATGDYRFLDLPGWYELEAPVLSPDGRHVAYWTTGTTTSTPNAENGGNPAAGIAVYDTVTGDVVEHEFSTEHGLSPTGLGWRDSSHLQATHYQWIVGDDGSAEDLTTANDQTWWQWEVKQPAPEPWPLGERLGVEIWGTPAEGRQVVRDQAFRLWILSDSAAPRKIGAAESLMYDGGTAISPDGTRIAGIWGNGQSPNKVGVLSWPEGRVDAERLERAGNSRAVHGWTDGEHVAVTRQAEPMREGGGLGVFEVDAATGEVEQIVRLPDDWYSGVTWASDLLGSPVVD
ncbi:MAG: hypothetical protein ACRDO4_00015, partial [Nocardioides sp.]